MLGIFVRYLKDKKNTIIGYVVGAIAFLEMYVSIFPFIQKQQAQLEAVMKTYPPEFFKAFGATDTTTLLGKLEGYLSTEHYNSIGLLLLLILAVSLANAIAINDVDKGTIELTLAQPVSRTKIFLSRYLAGLVSLIAFVFVSNYSLLILVKFHNTSVGLKNLFMISVVMSLLGLAVFSIASLFSVMFSQKGAATFLSSGILILMFVMNVLSSLKDSLKNLQYFSLFHYYNPTQVFANTQYVKYTFVLFPAVIIVFTVLAIVWFNQRDIAV
jgi:ABC-2 type transport system permease protein